MKLSYTYSLKSYCINLFIIDIFHVYQKYKKYI